MMLCLLPRNGNVHHALKIWQSSKENWDSTNHGRSFLANSLILKNLEDLVIWTTSKKWLTDEDTICKIRTSKDWAKPSMNPSRPPGRWTLQGLHIWSVTTVLRRGDPVWKTTTSDKWLLREDKEEYIQVSSSEWKRSTPSQSMKNKIIIYSKRAKDHNTDDSSGVIPPRVLQ